MSVIRSIHTSRLVQPQLPAAGKGSVQQSPDSQQAIAQAPFSAALSGAQWKSQIKFGAGSEQGFDLQKFLAKDIGSGLEDLWIKASQTATGREVTPEDLILAAIEHFEDDLAQYRASDDKRNYFCFSYFGKVLGMNNSLHFDGDRAREIEVLHKFKDTIRQALDATAVPEESRSHTAGDRLSKYFRVSKETFRTVKTQAPDKLTTSLVNEEFMMQIIAKQDADSAGKWVRELQDELRLKPTLVLEEFMSDAAKATDAKEIDAKKPQNLTQIAQEAGFVPAPGLSSQLGYLTEQLGWNHVKVLLLQVPKSIQSDKAIQALAHHQAFNNPHAVVPFFKINLAKYFEGTEAEKGLDNFRAAVRDIARENPKAVIYLPGFENTLRRQQKEVDGDFFNGLAPNANLKFIIPRVEGEKTEMAMPRNPHAMQALQAGQLQMTPWTLPNFPGLLQGALEPPSTSETVEYIKHYKLKTLEAHHPGVKFSDASIQKAVEMASLTKEVLLDTAVEFLEVASQRFPNGELTEDRIKRAVKSDPHLGFATKVSLNGSYQRLGELELATLLENTPQTVGADTVKDFLGRVSKGIQDPTQFKQFGLKPSTRGIIAGAPGTAKTDMVMRFAKEQKLPLVYVSGKELGHLPTEQIKKILEQAFIAAKNESNRKENRGEKPHVMVVVDNLEAAARPDPQGGEGAINPLLGVFLMELNKLKEEENQHLITLGLTNSQLGFHPAFAKKELVDEVIEVEAPTMNERLSIFQTLAQVDEAKTGKQLYAKDIDFKRAAQQLGGVTGKTLQVVLDKAKEVAMQDVGNTAKVVTSRHVDRAITDLTMGPENKKLYNIITPENRRATAYHEMGHTIAFQKMKEFLNTKASQLLKLTVMPQGQALGVMFSAPEEEMPKQTKTELFAQLVCTVASMPAEKLSIRDITAGNSMDRKQATQLAAAMINQVAMGKNKIVYNAKGDDVGSLPQKVQDEIANLIDQAEKAAEVIVRGYAPFIEDVVDRLAGKDGTGGEETIMGEDFIKLLNAFDAKNPKVAQRVEKQVIKVMTPLFPERYPQGLFQKWFGGLLGLNKPVFREAERLKNQK